jgi:hypothetical protein
MMQEVGAPLHQVRISLEVMVIYRHELCFRKISSNG